MGKKGAKSYTRQAREYGVMLENFNVPVGAIYGRLDQTYFVSLYQNVKRGQMSVHVKIRGEEWARKTLPVGSDVCQAIFGYIDAHAAELIPVGSWRNPSAKRRKHKKPEQAKSAPLQAVTAEGKRYRAIPYELPLPDRIASKEFRPVTPNLRGVVSDFNARMRPDRATYGVECEGQLYIFRGYEDAEAFCRKMTVSTRCIKQEFWYNEAVEVDYNQRTQYAYWANLDSATSGSAGTVACRMVYR